MRNFINRGETTVEADHLESFIQLVKMLEIKSLSDFPWDVLKTVATEDQNTNSSPKVPETSQKVRPSPNYKVPIRPKPQNIQQAKRSQSNTHDQSNSNCAVPNTSHVKQWTNIGKNIFRTKTISQNHTVVHTSVQQPEKRPRDQENSSPSDKKLRKTNTLEIGESKLHGSGGWQ